MVRKSFASRARRSTTPVASGAARIVALVARLPKLLSTSTPATLRSEPERMRPLHLRLALRLLAREAVR